MARDGRKPQGHDDLVEIAPAPRPIHVRFDEPDPPLAARFTPLRAAMFWIVLLVLLGLFWVSLAPKEPPLPRSPMRGPASGTTTL